MEMKKFTLEVVPFPEARDINTISLDPKLGLQNERLALIKDLKKVQIGHLAQQVTKIGTSLSK